MMPTHSYLLNCVNMGEYLMHRLAMATGEKSLKAIGERLRITREALGRTQADFARRAKLSASAYNQYEKGRMRPAIDAAISLCEVYGITLDWIYLGDNSNIRPRDLREAIQAIRQIRSK